MCKCVLTPEIEERFFKDFVLLDRRFFAGFILFSLFSSVDSDNGSNIHNGSNRISGFPIPFSLMASQKNFLGRFRYANEMLM